MRKGKKIVAAMLAVFMVMTSLAGCGEEAEAPVSDQPESRTEQSSSTGVRRLRSSRKVRRSLWMLSQGRL